MILLPASALLAAPWVAPQGADVFESPTRVSMLRDAPAPLGEFHYGNLTPDGVPDAVAMSSDHPIVMYGSIQYRRRIELPLSAQDCAVLTRANADHTDAILAATDHSLESWSWSASQGKFVGTTILGTPTMVVSTTTGGTAFQRFVALSADGREAWIFSSQGGGATPQLVSQLSLLEVGTDAVILPWGGLSYVVAVSGDGGLTIYDGNGSDIAHFDRSSGSSPLTDRLCVLPNKTDDAILWLERDAALGEAYLHAIGAAGSESYDVSEWEPVSIAAGDVVGDPAADVALGRDLGGSAVVFENLCPLGGCSQVFDPSQALEVRTNADALGNTAGLVCADFDNDGDGELLVGDSASDVVWAWRGAQVDAAEVGGYYAHTSGPNFPLFYQGFFAILYFDDEALPPGATQVEVYGWSRPLKGDRLQLAPGLPLVIEPNQAVPQLELNLYFPADTEELYAFIDLHPVRRVAGEPPMAYPGVLGALSPDNDLIVPTPDESPCGIAADYETYLSNEYAQEGAHFSWLDPALYFYEYAEPGGPAPEPDDLEVACLGTTKGGVIIRIPEIPLDPPGGG